MPHRVAYWTSAFDPTMEAVAGEVALLRKDHPASVIWGINPTRWMRLSRRNGYILNPKLNPLFRLVTRLLEPAFQLNHIFGSVSAWPYLSAKRRRPTILTAATCVRSADISLLDTLDQIVVEYPRGREELAKLGVDPRRVRLIFPPVDLAKFHPTEPTLGRFTILFASSPDHEEWLQARGVPLLLKTAAQRPKMSFRLLWRPWGNSEAKVRQLIEAAGISNVEIQVGRCPDMPAQYRNAHVTIAPFTDLERCKPAPNSLVESLACGRPVILTRIVGLAELVSDSNAGLVVEANPESMASGLDRLQFNWATYAKNARQVAERFFCADQFVSGYRKIYDELVPSANGRN